MVLAPQYTDLLVLLTEASSIQRLLGLFLWILNDKARLELKRGGFDWDDDGNLIDSEGTRVEFDINTNESRAFICSIIVDSAEKLGMQINLVLTDFNTLVSRLMIPDYDAVFDRSYRFRRSGSVAEYGGWMEVCISLISLQRQRPGVVDPDIYESFDWENRIHEIFVEQAAETDDEQMRWDLFAEFKCLLLSISL